MSKWHQHPIEYISHQFESISNLLTRCCIIRSNASSGERAPITGSLIGETNRTGGALGRL
jgi:hypothetical protein